MHRSVPRLRSLIRMLAVLALAAGVLTAPSAHAAGGGLRPSGFHGVNWADQRDNYVDGPVIPSGLSTSDSYATTYAKATAILDGFRDNLGANTVRLPVNPYSVGTAWWNSYRAAIDAATAHGYRVVLSYWEGVQNKDGRVDDTSTWWSMWSTLTNTYANNAQVYFEPMNEPFGYSTSEWTDLVASWIARFPSVPRDRIFVSGTGYNDDVTGVCADSRLDGTYLSLHDYGFWATHDYAGWMADFAGRIGNCASRTVLDEFGAPMTTGLDYDGPSTASNFVAYLQAATETVRTLGLGSIYWPGLRTGDTYSMETLHGSGTDLTLTDNSPSGVDRLEYAWGGTTSDELRNPASGRCLDVTGASHTPGTGTEIWDCNGGANQDWTLTSSGQLKVYGNLCLDAYQQGTAPGTEVDVYTCNGGANQQWRLNTDGTVTGVQSGLCLDVTGGSTADGAEVELWTCNGGDNQEWSR